MIRTSVLTLAFALAVGTSALAQQFPTQPPPVNGAGGFAGNR